MLQRLQAFLVAKYMASLSVQQTRKACVCSSVLLPAATCNFQRKGVISLWKTAAGLSETHQRKTEWFHMGIAICLKCVLTCCSTTPFPWFPRLANGGALAGVSLSLPCLLWPLSSIPSLWWSSVIICRWVVLQLLLHLSLASVICHMSHSHCNSADCRLLRGIKIACCCNVEH